MPPITIQEPTTQLTTLNGSIGKFKLPNNPFVLKYFQTSVSAKVPGSHEHRLLEEIKPIRDRMDISNISTVNDILQRDIDDSRIARDIIPYLLVTKRQPVFFPSIVVVLFPRENFSSRDNYYPKATAIEGGVNYEDYWKYENLPDTAGNATGLVKLQLNLYKAHPLAIDGQHRTAAFRWLSQIDSNNSRIYDNFYSGLNQPESFDSDLPVTILWFEHEESEDEIKIKNIAREIFIDINQSSQQISKSRHILMNNNSPSEFVTRRFYELLASKGYKANEELNLMYSGFDYPYDVSGNITWSSHTLFVPEIISYSFGWLLFAKRHFFSNLSNDKVNEPKKHSGSDFFELIVGEGNFEQFIHKKIDIEGSENQVINTVREKNLKVALSQNLLPNIYRHINSNGLYKAIFSTVNTISENFNSSDESPYTTPATRDAWKHMYLGAEGLYYIVNNSKNPGARDYQIATKTIESEFLFILSEKLSISLSETKQLLKSMQSVAYLVGYLAALNYFTDRYDSFHEAANTTEHINEEIDWSIYLKALEIFKKDYIKSVDPKTWPSYRNIYLRVAHHYSNNVYQDEKTEALERNLEDFYLRDYLKDHAKEVQVTNAQLKKDIDNENFIHINRENYEYMIEASIDKTRTKINELFGPDSYITS